MTQDTSKPLTADELNKIFDEGVGWCGETTFARIRAVIEQRDEQIEKLREALLIAKEYVIRVDGVQAFTAPAQRLTKPDLDKINEALAETKP